MWAAKYSEAMGMNITRAPQFERWLLDKIKAWLESQPRAEGLHVSDILYPMKAYWKKVDPRPMTDTEAGYFVAGLGHHYIIESIIEGSKKVGKADSGTNTWEGIYYSPDILTPHPLEIKTSRSKIGPATETPRGLQSAYEHYLAQLTAYMAIRNDPKGDLLVFYLNLADPESKGRSIPQFRWYPVVLTKKELADRRVALRITKGALLLALKKKDPKNLELCPQWQCRGCQWLTKCQPWKLDPSRARLDPKAPKEKRSPRGLKR